MDQGNGNNQAIRGSPSASRSIFLIVIMLFMMFSGESQRVSQIDMKDSLQSLVDEHSNFTAYLEGRPTNFTLNQESNATSLLRNSLFHPTLIPPLATTGYYNNLTGNYKAKKIWFHNLTDPPNQVGWGPLSRIIYEDKNTSLIHAAAGGWDWKEPMHMSLSLFFYKSHFLSADSPLFYRFRGFIELGPPNPEKGLLPSPTINLRMEGVHIPHNGSLYALVEQRSIMPDVRQLPSLVPPGFVNSTAQVVAAQLQEDIQTLEKSIQAGASRVESDEDPLTRCSFTFHGQLRPLLLHQNLVDEYEREIQNPSGIPVDKLMQPTFDAVFMSEECGIGLELEAVTGISSTRINRRIVTYSAIASLVCYILIQFSLQISDQWRTATSLHRGARGVIASWLIADSYAAITHLMAAVMSKEVRFAILVPGFLGCVLLATDLRLLTFLNGVQMMLAQAQAQAQAPAPAPTPTPTRPETPLDPTQSQLESTPVQRETTAPSTARNPSVQPPPISLRQVFTYLVANDFRAWLLVVGVVSITCMTLFNLPIYGAWFLLISSTWAAQILRNIYQRTRRVVRHDTVILSSVFRLFTPLYLFGCPDNLLGIEPAPWVWILPVWVALQITILIGQDYFGPSFFLPTLWTNEPAYDYHPDLAKADEESIDPKLGDCSICMEPISSDQGHISPNRPLVLQLCWTQMTKKRRVYALAPCGHNFHTSCLEQWMDIKSVCPQCRGPLPPL
ncbi:hypothetical protein M408DRAFT_332712 [Serendipita vermifera MAFF 305830]|uniref:RING-type E3 ubiquitin transferase n=1 Tax=Serendipita vermifera MAFF 305830 TaxID=933852 RepID=A0A0C2WZX4_SERVB|nr:hypothetical protein M408DRAFT_332712 [Serendipita vermifera MAFF 305830]